MFRFILHILILSVSCLIVSCTGQPDSFHDLSPKDQISYNFHVRPILSDNCFACHGPDANKREAGLRLDIEEGPTAH